METASAAVRLRVISSPNRLYLLAMALELACCVDAGVGFEITRFTWNAELFWAWAWAWACAFVCAIIGLYACDERPWTTIFGETFKLLAKVRVADVFTVEAPAIFGIAVDTLSAFAVAIALRVPSPFVLIAVVGDLVIVVWP